MKQITEKEIKDLLTPSEMPKPPAGLAERIKSEIPDEIVFETTGLDEPGGSVRVPMSRSRFWLMAASVVMAVGGSFLAYRLMDQMPRQSPLSQQTAESQADDVEPRIEAAAPQAEATATAGDEAIEPDRLLVLQDEERGETEAVERSAKLLALSLESPAEFRQREAPARKPPAGERSAAANQAPSSQPLVAPRDESARRLRQVQEKKRTEASPKPEPPRSAVLPSQASAPPPALRRRAAASETLESELEKSLDEDLVVTSEYPVVEQIIPVTDVDTIDHSGTAASTNTSDEVERLPVMRTVSEAVNLAPGVHDTSGRRVGGIVTNGAMSTGGTAEPNDAPYGDVFFQDAGTNPFIDTEDDALSTFGLDVDTASYTVVRRYLSDGHLPPREAVRVEELINYFDYGDAAPETEDFAIHAEGAPSIYGQGDRYHLLRFNLSGREIATEDRRPALLTFVVDVSGSMAQENRLGLVKQALALLLDQLRDDDRIALVVYGSRGQVLIEPTADRGAIRRGIEQLRTGGSTNAEEGLTLAYDLAARHRRQGAINRVILCSDGVANVGNTSAGSILDRIRREANQGIELTTVGFGMGNYNDVLMERLADDGNGRYAYVDTLDEARRIFVENLTGTLQTLAAEARTQVDFNPQVVSRYRLLGYENRDIADERFRDDTVDAGEIGVGHTVTALYEIKLHRKPRPRDKIATLHLRYGSIAKGEMVELARTVTGADFVRSWDHASPALRLTSLVAEFAEILKRSYWAKEGDLEDVFRRAQKVSAELPGNHEAADFVSLVGRASKAWEREAKR